MNQPIKLRRGWLALLAAVCVVLTIVGRRHHDTTYFAMIAVSVIVAGFGVADILSPRRAQPLLHVVGRVIHIRSLTARDADALAATIDVDVMAENRWDPGVRDRFIEVIRNSQPTLAFAICDHATGDVAGVIQLAPSSLAESEWDLGIWIGPEHRGRGFASEAVPLFVSTLNNKVYPSVGASTSVGNIAVQRAVQRAEFVEVNRYRHQFDNGDGIEAIRYSRPLPPAATTHPDALQWVLPGRSQPTARR
jgi:RimJ/RimL family protein N-acetyltransferase